MVNKNRNTYLLSIVFLLFTLSCKNWKETKITISKDYVINPNWDEVDNSLQVIIMDFKVDSDCINLQKVTIPELLKKLVEDESFSYTANVKYNGEKYYKRRVYFNRDNGFTWWAVDNKSSKRILGELKQDTWYLLCGLSKFKTLYYVYLDSLDSLHSFKVPASYWTNY